MAVVLEFDELPENAQVMLATQSGGCLIGRAVPAGGGGGAANFSLVIVGDSDHVFNGDGSSGAVQIFPKTIVQCQVLETALRSFKFAAAGVGDGWIVFLNLEGVNPGACQVLDENDNVILNLNDVSTLDNRVVVGLYMDSGHWTLLRNKFITSS